MDREPDDRLMDENLRVLRRAHFNYQDPRVLETDLQALGSEIVGALATTNNTPAVVFLDTLAQLNAADENDAAAWRPLFQTAYALADTLGCSVWALHHLRKSGTGRNAPSLLDRLDPEMVRGSSALMGAIRACVQLGWITGKEAAEVGLNPAEGCNRRYALLALTKANGVPLSTWEFLEHSGPGGTMAQVLGGQAILAKLRGGLNQKLATRGDVVVLGQEWQGGAASGHRPAQGRRISGGWHRHPDAQRSPEGGGADRF